MSGPWKVEWIGDGLHETTHLVTDGDRFAIRHRADGTSRLTWPTREAAERASARLNRKWAHECLGTWCTAHPAPFVERVWTEIGMVWVAWTEDGRGITHGGTHAEAFAAALAYAKENQS